MSAAAFITLTGNLLAERTQEFATWAPGRTQRALRESFQVGGKGINVAKMLARLGAPVTALCFTGGASGAECADWLARQAFASRAFPSGMPTRTGLVVRAPGLPETTFLGPDRAPDAAALAACAHYLDTLPGTDTVALCGSFPGWESPGAASLRAALARRAAAGTLVVDSYGPPLAWALQQPCALIKINRTEFDGLMPPATPHERDPKPRLRTALERSPVRSWIVTNGPEDVWFADQHTAPASLRPVTIREVSATGSGDVLFACALHAMQAADATLADAVAFALPYAAANAAHPGIAEFPLPLAPGPRPRLAD